MGSDFQEDHAARSAGAPGRDARGKSGIFALYCGPEWARKTTFRAVAMAPYNKRMQRTVQSVTHFAKRKMRATLPCR